VEGIDARVAETIRLELAQDVDGDDLRSALATRGLAARRVDGGETVELEVFYEREESERLASDLASALDEWVSERGLPFVPTPIDGRVYALRPPGD
jgi:hypothetical protein